MEKLLDEYVQRLQNIQPFNIYRVDETTGKVEPWFEVTAEITNDLVLREQSLGHQVQIVSGEVNKWHRLASQAKRVWQIEERRYRVWRDRLYLKAIEEAEGKKPSDKIIEAGYRTHKDYGKYYGAVERAEEAYNSCLAVVEGFRAKRDMMKSYVFRHRDDAAPQLSV